MAVCYDKSCDEVDSIKYKQVICIIRSETTNTNYEPYSNVDHVTSSVGSCAESTLTRMVRVERVSTLHDESRVSSRV